MTKNKAAVSLGRKGGKAKVSKGPMANRTPSERAAWAAKMVAAKAAKRAAAELFGIPSRSKLPAPALGD